MSHQKGETETDRDGLEPCADSESGVAGSTTADARCLAGVHLFPPILRSLARGGPLSAEDIAGALGLPPYLAASVVATIAHVFPDAEFGTDGRLLGLGLSLVPTSYEVVLEGQGSALYAGCALDALLLPASIGETAHITSPCDGMGESITVTVGADGVQEVRPDNAVVVFVADADGPNHTKRGSHQNFFALPDAAAAWRSEHPSALTLPVADAFNSLSRSGERSGLVQPQDAVDAGQVLGHLVLAALRTSGHRVEEIPCRLVMQKGSTTATSGEPLQVGDMCWDPEFAGWLDSEAHRARGGGPHLIVRLPNGWDWDLDGPMSNGLGWWRTGDPPHITAWPSILAGDHHGFLVGGRLYRLAGESR